MHSSGIGIPDRENVVQLNYLGLRMAMGKSSSDRRLMEIARDCEQRRWRVFAQKSARDLAAMQMPELPNLRAEMLKQSGGAVICLAHIGPYHRVPFELVRHDCPVVLLVDRRNHSRELLEYPDWIPHYSGQHPDPIQYVDAESPTAAWQVHNSLGQGRVLCIWIDGNSGLKGATSERTTVTVQYFGLDLQVRRGPAHFAANANVPLYAGLIGESDSGDRTLRLLPQIARTSGQSLRSYCQQAMQDLYSLLELTAGEDPASWEMWYHLHRWRYRERALDLQEIAGMLDDTMQNSLILDADNLSILILGGVRTLVHEVTCSAFEMTPLVCDVVTAVGRRRILAEICASLRGRYSKERVVRAVCELLQGGVLHLGSMEQ